jgi:hypothetical protein
MNDQSSPPESAPDAPDLDFDRVQPVEGGAPPQAAGPLACVACRQPIVEQYYDLNGAIACAGCRGAIVAHLQSPLGSRRFWRAFGLGSGAAIVSAILWYAVGAITHAYIGIVAVAVGYIVGVAVKRGGEGRGGRKLQVLALLLTYCAMSMANIPLVVAALVKMADEHKSDAKATAEDKAGAGDNSKPDDKPTTGRLAVAIAAVIALAFAAPFLGGGSLFSLLFIGFALWEAWKINRAPDVKVSGPFRVGERVAA